jgi:hypothetical protein
MIEGISAITRMGTATARMFAREGAKVPLPASLEASDIVCVPSKAAIGLGYDFVGSAEIIEVVHIPGP